MSRKHAFGKESEDPPADHLRKNQRNFVFLDKWTKAMDTIILKGESGSNARLIIELAKKLNFKAKKLTADEAEELGVLISIEEGIKSGKLDADEREVFLQQLNENIDS